MKSNFTLTLGWLYPDLMSIYGDRGNVIVLQKRCEWRGITMKIKPIGLDTSSKALQLCDLLLMGGAQDRQQTIVAKDLYKKKGILKQMIDSGVPGLYICGGYQFLGKYYQEADGTKIEQLGLLDFFTQHPGDQTKRYIGNMSWESAIFTGKKNVYVGFENHGGRTYLGPDLQPLGTVVHGSGNNGEDGYEGLLYKHTIGTYCHGPLLPKNPEIADWFIIKALQQRYNLDISLTPLDDRLAMAAREIVLQKI